MKKKTKRKINQRNIRKLNENLNAKWSTKNYKIKRRSSKIKKKKKWGKKWKEISEKD